MTETETQTPRTSRNIIPISGKDSLTTAIVQTTRNPNVEYEFIFNQTGAEFPDTLEWLNKIEIVKGWQIQRIDGDLKSRIHSYNGFLPSPVARYCTRESKIAPMQKFLGKDRCNLYYGLRIDEPTRVGYVPVAGDLITPIFPLRELGIDLRGVYSLLSIHDLLPPDYRWARLENAVSNRLSSYDWRQSFLPWEISQLFSGRSRDNCYFCFYQRQSEHLWLMEAYPDLFEKALSFEKDNYKWRSDFGLDELKQNKSLQRRIFAEKVKQTCKRIVERLQLNLFAFEDNEITSTSCGLLCGK
jgi:hypothetical protein